MTDEIFYDLYMRTCAHDVSPEIFLLHDDPHNRFRIALNYFDKALHHQFFLQKKITPHMHHFSFSTRILSGGYFHWIYKNKGSLEDPNLETASQSFCDAGDVYTMPFNIFHFVVSPKPDTLSLMVRGKIELDAQHNRYPLKKEFVLSRRDTILKILEEQKIDQAIIPGRKLSLNTKNA
jgi:hypothetical protein